MSKHTSSPGQTAAKLRALHRSPTLGAVVAGCLVLLAILMVFFDGHLEGVEQPDQGGTEASQRTGKSSGMGPGHPSANRRASQSHKKGAPGELDEVSWLAMHGGTRFERLEAISALGSSHDHSTEKILRDLLSDPDPENRDAAVESLAALGTPGAIDGLAFALLDESPLVRRSALELLAENGTARAIEALAITLHEPHHALRSSVVHELADLDSPPARSLLGQFRSDHDPRVRRAAELAFQSPP